MGGTSTDVSRYDGEYEHVFESNVAGVCIQAPQVERGREEGEGMDISMCLSLMWLVCMCIQAPQIEREGAGKRGSGI